MACAIRSTVPGCWTSASRFLEIRGRAFEGKARTTHALVLDRGLSANQCTGTREVKEAEVQSFARRFGGVRCRIRVHNPRHSRAIGRPGVEIFDGIGSNGWQ